MIFFHALNIFWIPHQVLVRRRAYKLCAKLQDVKNVIDAKVLPVVGPRSWQHMVVQASRKSRWNMLKLKSDVWWKTYSSDAEAYEEELGEGRLQGEEWTFGRWQQTWCRYLSDFYVLYFHVSCFAPCETFRLLGFYDFLSWGLHSAALGCRVLGEVHGNWSQLPFILSTAPCQRSCLE